jgi:hypothetical protein
MATPLTRTGGLQDDHQTDCGPAVCGLYGSHHSAELDQVAEQMFQNDQGDANYGLIDRSMRS